MVNLSWDTFGKTNLHHLISCSHLQTYRNIDDETTGHTCCIQYLASRIWQALNRWYRRNDRMSLASLSMLSPSQSLLHATSSWVHNLSSSMSELSCSRRAVFSFAYVFFCLLAKECKWPTLSCEEELAGIGAASLHSTHWRQHKPRSTYLAENWRSGFQLDIYAHYNVMQTNG